MSRNAVHSVNWKENQLIAEAAPGSWQMCQDPFMWLELTPTPEALLKYQRYLDDGRFMIRVAVEPMSPRSFAPEVLTPVWRIFDGATDNWLVFDCMCVGCAGEVVQLMCDHTVSIGNTVAVRWKYSGDHVAEPLGAVKTILVYT